MNKESNLNGDAIKPRRFDTQDWIAIACVGMLGVTTAILAGIGIGTLIVGEL